MRIKTNEEVICALMIAISLVCFLIGLSRIKDMRQWQQVLNGYIIASAAIYFITTRLFTCTCGKLIIFHGEDKHDTNTKTKHKRKNN